MGVVFNYASILFCSIMLHHCRLPLLFRIVCGGCFNINNLTVA